VAGAVPTEDALLQEELPNLDLPRRGRGTASGEQVGRRLAVGRTPHAEQGEVGNELSLPSTELRGQRGPHLPRELGHLDGAARHADPDDPGPVRGGERPDPFETEPERLDRAGRQGQPGDDRRVLGGRDLSEEEQRQMGGRSTGPCAPRFNVDGDELPHAREGPFPTIGSRGVLPPPAISSRRVHT